MITTTDNPYDPFTHYDEWLVFDKLKGYHTNERLASITLYSDQLSDSEVYETIEAAMEELIKFGAIDKNGEIVEYKKVYREIKPKVAEISKSL